MLKKRFKFIVSLIIVFSFLSCPVFVFGDSSLDDEIVELQDQIHAKQQELEKIKEREQEYKKRIKEKQSEQASLKTQIAIFDGNIAKTEIEIQSTQINIDKTNLEIKKVTLEIQEIEADIQRKKEYLASLLRLIAKSDDKSTLEIILIHNSISEFLDQIEYIKNLNTSLDDILDKVKEIKAELEEQNENLEKKKQELEELKKELEEQKADIGDQKINKQFILDKTKQSEKEYQQLLSKAKAEQEQANTAIIQAEREIRKRIAEQQGKDALKFIDKGLIWPIAKNIITAYFHDPDYPYRHIFEHPGIDVRAKQGTPIMAAASGYIAKAKDAGYGYSYIMIVHGDGLSTVYGHVSRIDVQADEFIAQGQIVGATGGMPGTKGAGYLTTGPHLHFEVRLDGIPVNPLNYLP